jgi:hypothetical protein
MATEQTIVLKTINVGDATSVKDLRQELDEIANSYVIKTSTLVGMIYEFAVAHKELFDAPLKKARQSPGEHIGTSVPKQIADELEEWSKNSNPKRSRGRFCCYILQKCLEDGLITQVMSRP